MCASHRCPFHSSHQACGDSVLNYGRANIVEHKCFGANPRASIDDFVMINRRWQWVRHQVDLLATFIEEARVHPKLSDQPLNEVLAVPSGRVELPFVAEIARAHV